DRRTGYVFQVNAAGARFDGLIVTAEDVSADWDGIWDARVGRDSSGWTLEVAIPAATLRFTPGLSPWGFNVSRNVARHPPPPHRAALAGNDARLPLPRHASRRGPGGCGGAEPGFRPDGDPLRAGASPDRFRGRALGDERRSRRRRRLGDDTPAKRGPDAKPG